MPDFPSLKSGRTGRHDAASQTAAVDPMKCDEVDTLTASVETVEVRIHFSIVSAMIAQPNVGPRFRSYSSTCDFSPAFGQTLSLT